MLTRHVPTQGQGEINFSFLKIYLHISGLITYFFTGIFSTTWVTSLTTVSAFWFTFLFLLPLTQMIPWWYFWAKNLNCLKWLQKFVQVYLWSELTAGKAFVTEKQKLTIMQIWIEKRFNMIANQNPFLDLLII